MPHTEHPIDVWYNYETGRTLDRMRDQASANGFHGPPINDILKHKWYAFRYRDSQCEKTNAVPHHAYFTVPHTPASSRMDADELQWHDESQFEPSELHSDHTFPVYSLDTTVRQHETAPKQLFPPHRPWHPPPLPVIPAVLNTDDMEKYLDRITKLATDIENTILGSGGDNEEYTTLWNRVTNRNLANLIMLKLVNLYDVVNKPWLWHILPETIRFLYFAIRQCRCHDKRWRNRFTDRFAHYMRKDLYSHSDAYRERASFDFNAPQAKSSTSPP